MSPSRPRRILLIGWSGADGKIIQPLLDSGQMPALEKLIANGVFGEISTLSPLVTPSLWTSIATGKRPFQHGVLSYAELNQPGEHPQLVTGRSRRSKTVWEILSRKGLRCHVTGWPCTHREPEFLGACVSDAFAFLSERFENSISPARLCEKLREFRVAPDEIDADVIRLFVPRFAEVDQRFDNRLTRLAAHLAECASIHAAATWMAVSEPWDFAAIFLPTLDRISREFIEYHPPKSANISEELFELYCEVVAGAYRFLDLLLARMLQFVGSDDVVILVSEHGYHSGQTRADNPIEQRPAGLLAMCGPGVRRDDLVFGGNILHITPTILALFGLPIGRDMEYGALHDAFIEPLHTSTIPTWEPAEVVGSGLSIDPVENQMLNSRFIELGQIPSLTSEQSPAAAVTMVRTWNMALSYLDAGRDCDALPLLQQIHALQPERIDVAETLARCQMRLGKLVEAEETIEAIRDFAGDQPFTKLLLGILAYRRGDFETSLDCLDSAGHADSRATGVHHQIGLTLSRMGRWTQAEQVFHRAVQARPTDAYAHLGLAHSWFYQGRFLESAESALNAIALQYHLPFAHLTLGIALCRLQEWPRAVTALENAVRLAPALPAPRRILAHLYRRMPKTNRSSIL